MAYDGDLTSEDRKSPGIQGSKLNAALILKRCDRLFSNSERANAEALWDEITEFIAPNQHGFFFDNDGDRGSKRTRRLFDSIGAQSSRDLAAAIHGTVTNPAQSWFQLEYENPAFNEDVESAMFIDQANNLLLQYINESNFSTEVAKAYHQWVSLGNMAVLHEDQGYNEKGLFKGFHFKCLHLSQLAWSENSKGQVDVVYRKFKMTARQISERFSDISYPEKIKEAMEIDPEKEFDCVHALFPRPPSDVKLNKSNMAAPEHRPIASVYVCKEGQCIMEEGGYYEFPIYVARWETAAEESYGRGPGHIAIPDVRSLNKTKELALHALAKAIDPPIIAEQRCIFNTLDLRPKQVSVVKDIKGFTMLEPRGRFDVTQFEVEGLRNAIRSVFFLDKIQLPPREEIGEMSAYESAKRIEQMQRVFGPTLDRLNFEFLDPCVSRAFNMMLRMGAFGTIPNALLQNGINIKVQYINHLARAQQIEDITSIQGWMQDLGMMAQGRPEVLDLIDVDSAARLMAQRRGVPGFVVATKEVVNQARQARAQQQQQMMALEAGVKAADIAAKSSQASQDGRPKGS